MRVVTLRYLAIMPLHSRWSGMDQRQHGEPVTSMSKHYGCIKCPGEESSSHTNLLLRWQPIAEPKDSVTDQGRPLSRLKTSLSISRSMWLPSTSFALSRECHGFKLFQCLFFSCDIQEESNEVVNCALCIHDFMRNPRQTRLLGVSIVLSIPTGMPSFQDPRRCMLHLRLWSACSVRSMFQLHAPPDIVE